MKDSLSRYLEAPVAQDLGKKMVFIGGPRQTGKTTLSKRLLRTEGLSPDLWYFNWDDKSDRAAILREEFPTGKGLLVLDEVHKYARWRGVLKGLYDKRKESLKILVTGSARLDHYRKGGDSLQGRYHHFRIHPLSYAELRGRTPADLEDLLQLSGFPEPFFSSSAREARRWSREYASRVLEEDLVSLENVKDVSLLELLVAALPERVGSPLSLNGLREDLQVSHQTVSRWVDMLENLYLIFRIHPFVGSLLRSVKKESKHYHYDWTVARNRAIRYENLVACHLLKWCHFQQDYEGRNLRLHFYRDMDGREVDFVIAEAGKPIELIECKTSADRGYNQALWYLKSKYPGANATLLSLEGKEDVMDKNGVRHCPAHTFLEGLI